MNPVPDVVTEGVTLVVSWSMRAADPSDHANGHDTEDADDERKMLHESA